MIFSYSFRFIFVFVYFPGFSFCVRLVGIGKLLKCGASDGLSVSVLASTMCSSVKECNCNNSRRA